MVFIYNRESLPKFLASILLSVDNVSYYHWLSFQPYLKLSFGSHDSGNPVTRFRASLLTMNPFPPWRNEYQEPSVNEARGS
ncbi:hypothetical protein E6O75_ATG04076 [Venturia nashicola]|uniref:Uncharacterized protein n=1 Tax=Venturia nashicola TaxID=86259 RepID=A0A4Z1PH71_9PEZI|nr:hypothetical protein E6O75_ATG04076 [Venturia nashicola]